MKKFRHKFIVNAKITDVTAFHSSTLALKKLNIPLIVLRFHRVDPLAENSISNFTIWMGPLPIRWVARHRDVSVNHGFVDEQISGPFQKWIHRHSFIQVSEAQTEIIDEIEYELSSTFFWKIVGQFIVWNLPITFAYRAWVTRATLEGKLQ